MGTSWFRQLIEDEIDRRGGNVAQLARDIGIVRATIDKWREGADPRLQQVEKVLQAVGWDIRRAMPGEPEHHTPARIVGRVSAGAKSLAFEHPQEIDGLPLVWRRSVYNHLVSSDPIVYVEVSGSSMEPDFPDGSLLACGRPANGSIPDFTPVIARVHDEATFKLYRQTSDRRHGPEVELIPINRTFDVQRYHPREVSIDYIVLGYVNPWKEGLTMAPRSPVFRQDNAPPKPLGDVQV